MSILPSPIPHPLEFNPWELPGWVYEAFDWVIGVEWPDGDERSVWDVADQWYGVAGLLAGPRDDATAAAGEVIGGYGGVGTVAGAFDAAWRRMADGDEAPLNVLLAFTGDLGRLVEECGADIEGAKLEAWIELGILAVELMSVAVLTVATAGAASPAAGAAVTASRFVVQRIFKRLLTQLARKELKRGLKEAGERAAKGGLRGLGRHAAKGGLLEAAEETGVSLATQAYQNATGRRHGLDVAELGYSALGGAAGGAVVPLAGLGRHAQGRGARIAEHLGREMTGETLAEGAASLATGQGALSWEDAARAAASGTTGATTGQVDHALRARLDGQLSALAGPIAPTDLPDPSVPVGQPAEDTGPRIPSPRPPAPVEVTPPAVTHPAGIPGHAAQDLGAEAPALVGLADGGPSAPAPAPPLAEAPMPASPVVAAASDQAAAGTPGPIDTAPSDPTIPTAREPIGAAGHLPPATGTVEVPASPQAGGPSLSAVAVDHPASGLPTTTQPATHPPATAATGTAATTAPPPGPPVAPTVVTGSAPGPLVTSGVAPLPTHPANNSAVAAPHVPAVSGASAVPPHAVATGAAVGSPPISSPPDPSPSPPHAGQRPATPVEGNPPRGAGGPPDGRPGERTGAADPAHARRVFEALNPGVPTAPRTDMPPTPPVADPSLFPPRTPEWYAATWALERDALERNRYKGYFEAQRAWYEENRREELSGQFRGSAEITLERARWLRNRARELVNAGRRLIAEHTFQASRAVERQSYRYADQAEAVREGRLVPETVVIDSAEDFHRINNDVADLALGGVETGDRSALTGDDVPPPSDRSRPYGQWGGLRPPLALHQTDLERQMPRHVDGRVLRTADPRVGGWFGLMNDGGPAADATRGINCLDCTLSFYDTWMHGRPRVSAPRTFDGYSDGDINRPISGEAEGPRRVEEVTGGRFQRLVAAPEDPVRHPAEARYAVDRGFRALADQLRLGGHGSYAFVITEWEGGGSHAWVALNQHGTVLYLDPQSGEVRDRPLYAHSGQWHPGNVSGMDALVLGGDGHPRPLHGLGRGRFSALPDLPAPSTSDGRAGHGGPDLNRLYFLDDPGSTGPGAVAPGSPPADQGGTTAGAQEERNRAWTARIAAGVSVRDVLNRSVDLDGVFAAGVRPAEFAAEAEPATLRRLVPQLDEAAAGDLARLLADDRVRRMLEATGSTPPAEKPMLAETLVRQLAGHPDLVRMMLTTPELASSLTARPVTLHNLAERQQGIDVLGVVLADIGNRGATAVLADGVSIAAATPLSPEQRRISAQFQDSQEPAVQPGFDSNRVEDADYVRRYLDELYGQSVSAQAEVTELARQLAHRSVSPAEAQGRAEPKDRQRAEDKVKKYNGDASLLTDLAAAKVIFTNLSDLYRALESLSNNPALRILEFEDRFVEPQRSGYRDILMTVRTSGGHVAEFRLHLKAVEDVATWEHSLYEVTRDLKAVARGQGRSMSGAERAIVNGVLRQQQHWFWVALRKSLDGGGHI
ncbi:hypothetical protein K7640_10155 [Micromonospora sp. PLK6-60]|uniref:toxin glutamine deamidase domain-containing protein n=1 Tax=Micromonospora sp. PLK6-60 TaxID=2873383 RepID=UPI001CA71A7D|nr:toxin glutamine deamidase domain-containing protein [Micromonospora sp. PLK6-60]MBY8872202.1 hypothetical protein [Micromonospora sp. PLK6-60]